MPFFLHQRTSFSEHERLDYAVSQLPFLLYRVESSLKKQLQRLREMRGRVREVHLKLYCEYGEEETLVRVSPYSPEATDDQILRQLEHQLTYLDLSNPIREFEMELVPEWWALPVDEFLDFQLAFG